jgi:ABC-type sugar transport system permease subunit
MLLFFLACLYWSLTFSFFMKEFLVCSGDKKMELAQKQNLGQSYLLTIAKSFLIWSFTLTVCMIVVGFPILVLLATVCSFLAIVLQTILPISAVLLVVGGIGGVHVLGILIGAAILTAKGIHPHEVSWLRWLHGEASPSHTSVYASCPLTCGLTK